MTDREILDDIHNKVTIQLAALDDDRRRRQQANTRIRQDLAGVLVCVGLIFVAVLVGSEAFNTWWAKLLLIVGVPCALGFLVNRVWDEEGA